MQFCQTVAIAASPDKVFALATDLDRWSKAIKSIVRVEKLTPGPVAVGTRFKETRVMFGRECTEEMTFTELNPPTSYTLEANACGCLYRSVFKVASQGDGSELTLSFDAKPLTFFAKLMSPLGKLMAGTMRKCIQQDLEHLKAALESPA